MNAERLRQELIRRQAGSSGRDFARKLGISESYWSLIKRGERPLTLPVIERALREFPDLAPLFAAELAQRDEVWLAGRRPTAAPARRGLSRQMIGRVLFNGVLAATVAAGLLVATFGPTSRTQRFAIFGMTSGAALADEDTSTAQARPTRTPTPSRTPTRTPTAEPSEQRSEDRARPTRTPTPNRSSPVQNGANPHDEIDCEHLDELSGKELEKARRFCDRQEEKERRREEFCQRKTRPPALECNNEDSEESNNDSDGGEDSSSGDDSSH